MNSLEPYLVYSDNHGRFEHCRSIDELYPGIRLISGGDGVDGYHYSDAQAYVEWVLAREVTHLAGNHDWVTDAVMNETDPEKREAWAVAWHNSHFHTLGSYGLKNFDKNTQIETDEMLELADQLKEKMIEKGHMEYFKKLMPYFDGGSFIVVHAGFESGRSLDEQKAELDACFGKKGGIVDYGAEPIQIFDNGKQQSYKLAKSLDGLIGSDKTLVTGHFHNSYKKEARKSAHGKRIRLASSFGDSDAPIYVWESWSGKVVPVYPKEPYKIL